MELVQGLGVVSVVASLPGLSAVSPLIGVVGGVAAGVASVIKSQIIGNIPAKNTDPVPVPAPIPMPPQP
jgi:hypothetical protein